MITTPHGHTQPKVTTTNALITQPKMTTTNAHRHKEESTTHSHTHDVSTSQTQTEVLMQVGHMEETSTTTHQVFQPHRIQMNTVVLVSHTPLVHGKEILNEHMVESSPVLNEQTSLMNEKTVESSSLASFNSILYTSTESHSGAPENRLSLSLAEK